MKTLLMMIECAPAFLIITGVMWFMGAPIEMAVILSIMILLLFIPMMVCCMNINNKAGK